MYDKLVQEFEKNGYCILRNVLSPFESERIRFEAVQRLTKCNDYTMTPSEFLSFEVAASVLFKNRVMSLLETFIGGNLFFYPNFTIRNNLYIQWHTDDFFLSKPVEKTVFSPPEFFMCNIYLQSNSRRTGGGIDIVPGSHRLISGEKLKKQEKLNSEYITVKTQGGDLLIFDYRVIHRGTPPEEEIYKSRLAIQWTISRSKQYSKNYIDYMLRRRTEKLHLSDHTKQRALRYFNDMPNIKYPDSFSDSLIKKVEASNLEFVCLLSESS